jgi:protoporphyrinogen oxidase
MQNLTADHETALELTRTECEIRVIEMEQKLGGVVSAESEAIV